MRQFLGTCTAAGETIQHNGFIDHFLSYLAVQYVALPSIINLIMLSDDTVTPSEELLSTCDLVGNEEDSDRIAFRIDGLTTLG